jgi:hypothetical protein
MIIKHLTKVNNFTLYQFVKIKLPKNYCIFKPQVNERDIINLGQIKKIKEYQRNWRLKPIEIIHQYGWVKCNIEINKEEYHIRCGKIFFDNILKDILQEFQSIELRKDHRSINVEVYDDESNEYEIYLNNFNLNINDPYVN